MFLASELVGSEPVCIWVQAETHGDADVPDVEVVALLLWLLLELTMELVF